MTTIATRRHIGASLLLAGLLVLCAGAAAAPAPVPDVVVIETAKRLNTIVPDQALGAALDGMERGEVDKYLTPFNIEKMLSAGLRRVTYRTRPELGIEVWHWSDEGSWSDPAHHQGYWTGSDNPSREPRVTWGYSLPRRGETVDQANNEGYSRLDDGDLASFWKSNPYLDRRYTGATVSRPQWVVLSFKDPQPVDAARVLWGAPFASHYQIQYWDGEDAYWDGKSAATKPGRWTTFPGGDQTVSGEPASSVLRLAASPIKARFFRILLLQSSETALPGSTDVRDRLGYAIREVGLGVVGADGRFKDRVRHGKTRTTQTLVQVSSTDPWHRAIDRDLGTEQPSLDLVFRSGLNGGMPLMAPVGTLYDTPDNAAAEIRYIKRRGFPVSEFELGEEADGQFIDPEDYADLYLEVAKALRAVDPTLVLGGPSMQGAQTGTWPDTELGQSWTGRFVARLEARDGLDQLQFFSFEYYPFDDVCSPLGEMLRDETGLLEKQVRETAASGMPRSIPWVISEYGFSPFAGRAMSEVPNALFEAQVVGGFLSEGGSVAFMIGYTPEQPANQDFSCAGYGNMMLFQADDDGRSHWPMPSYYAEQMMMQDWGTPADQPHQLFGARAQATDDKGRPMVVAFPLLAANGRWSVMLVNRDAGRAHLVNLRFRDAAGAEQTFHPGLAVDIVQYSSADYTWLARGDASRPLKDQPPERFSTDGARPVLLPPMSLTVVSGHGPGPPPQP